MDSQGAQRPGLMLLKQKHHKVPLKSFLGYHANGHEGLEGAHRATETSCVPLQESTAHRCVFFVYMHQASPKSLDIDIYGADSLLSKRQK